ncbi:MAG TPA: TVP38/TMEM64 family protein [Rhizomicrobium sp.]|nr:TVP38/TMEM64 family protein [Rhizomicrobium sp.]
MTTKNIARGIALLLILAGIVLGVIYRNDIHPLAIRNMIVGNPWAPVIFIGLQIAASLLWVPRTVLGLAAGLLFGIAWGLIWAIVGATLGAAAGFGFARWMGGEGVLDHSPRIGRMIQRAEEGGWRAVAILRLIPGPPHSAINTLLALTELSWRDYLIGSFLGMLPITVIQVEIGASGSAVFAGEGGWLIGCLLLAVGLAASFLLKRAGRKVGGLDESDTEANA